MLVDTTEQEVATGEQKGADEVAEPVAQNGDEPVAENTEGAGADEVAELTEKELFARPEVLAKIKSEADSLAAKSVQTYQKKVEELTKRLTDTEIANQRKREDAELAALEGREQETWGDTPEVKEFQKTRREHSKWMSEVAVSYETFTQEKASFEKEKAQFHAEKLARQYGLPDSTVKEIVEGKDEDARELRAIKLSRNKPEDKPKRIVPDSSRRSAPGGIDWRNLSSDEKIKQGFKERK